MGLDDKEGKWSPDFDHMTVDDIMALEDWQVGRLLLFIIGRMHENKKRLTELAPKYAEYKYCNDEHKRLADMKSACQTMLRHSRDT